MPCKPASFHHHLVGTTARCLDLWYACSKLIDAVVAVGSRDCLIWRQPAYLHLPTFLGFLPPPLSCSRQLLLLSHWDMCLSSGGTSSCPYISLKDTHTPIHHHLFTLHLDSLRQNTTATHTHHIWHFWHLGIPIAAGVHSPPRTPSTTLKEGGQGKHSMAWHMVVHPLLP